MEAPETIICVECGGVAARLTTPPPDEGFLPGDVAAFICRDCGHRFDIVLEEDEGPGA